MLELFIFIDSFFDEYLLQRRKVQLFAQFASLYLQFLTQQIYCAISASSQHFRHGDEAWFVIIYHTAVWRIVHLTFREGIQRIYCLVARCLRFQMHTYLYVFRCIIVYLLDIQLTFLVRFHYRIHQHSRCHAVWHLYYLQCLVVYLLYLRTYCQLTASLSVVVFRHIHHTPCRKVWIQFKILSLQTCHRCITQFTKVMRQYSRIQAQSDTLRPLRQKQREFHWQRYRLFISSVIRWFPLCCLWIKHCLQRKFCQSRLYITWCCCPISGQYITPVTLTVNQQILLS